MASHAKSSFIDDAQTRTKTYMKIIVDAVEKNLSVGELNIPRSVLNYENKKSGKVRDVFTCKDCLVLIATDRQSAFDRVLTNIPFKGSVLNLTSSWWFDKIKSEGITNHHAISVPHPNVLVGKKCKVFPIEFVMRGYMTGSTSTSIWKLPDNIKKNQKLPVGNILTPTTKDEAHDELISASEILSRGLMSKEHWDTCEKISHKLFKFGQENAANRGLILVDTKYEFGLDSDGNVLLIDEVHTPDSSRYWISSSYEDRLSKGMEPENIDKEFLRLWYSDNCDPYSDKKLPDAPLELICELRYIMLYEVITGNEFSFPEKASPTEQIISVLSELNNGSR